MFAAPVDDPGHAPWIHVRNRLREMGYAIRTTYEEGFELGDAEWVMFMNVPQSLRPVPQRLRTWLHDLVRAAKTRRNDLFKRCLRSGLADRLALFLWEPEVVMPDNYDRAVHARFVRVFTWHAALIAERGRYRPIFLPQPTGLQAPPDVPFAQRKLLVNFSGNKRSAHPNELYSARVEVIRFMESLRPTDFDHFGPGWGPEFPSWRGTVPSKYDVYPRYRFGLCYENMHSVPGYITEKIFDCLRAGTVPVYWGAPDITEHVDAEAFVDRRDFWSTEALIDHLADMDEARWHTMREAGQRYLAGPRFARFLPEAFFTRIRDGLGI